MTLTSKLRENVVVICSKKAETERPGRSGFAGRAQPLPLLLDTLLHIVRLCSRGRQSHDAAPRSCLEIEVAEL
jgi:hypothetical protein